MSFENIERCLENLQCLLGIRGGNTHGFEPFDHQLLSRHYTFPFGNVAYRSGEDTFVGRVHTVIIHRPHARRGYERSTAKPPTTREPTALPFLMCESVEAGPVCKADPTRGTWG